MVLLSGYASRATHDTILLAQSNNEATAIPIRVGKHMRLPSPGVPCEVKCHAFAHRDETTGKSVMTLQAVTIKRASVTVAPRQRSLLNALRDPKSAAANPFASREDVVREVVQNEQLNTKTVEMMLADSSKNRQADSFMNRVILSGFIGHKAFLPPADDGSGDRGAVMFGLHQHAKAESALLLRVKGADARFSKELKVMHPLNVIAKVVVKAGRNAQNEIISRQVTLETDRSNIGMGTTSDFAGKGWPEWWRGAVESYYEQRREMADNARAQAADPKKPAAHTDDAAANPANPVQEPAQIW